MRGTGWKRLFYLFKSFSSLLTKDLPTSMLKVYITKAETIDIFLSFPLISITKYLIGYVYLDANKSNVIVTSTNRVAQASIRKNKLWTFPNTHKKTTLLSCF
jgi:hypothetical protein